MSPNTSAGLTQPNSSMSLVSLRSSQTLFLLSPLVFQEGMFPLLTPPLSTRQLHYCRRNAMQRWSLKVLTSSRLKVKSWSEIITIRSFLATILLTRIPLLSRRAFLHSGDLLLKSPPMRIRSTASLRLSSRRRIWASKTSEGSFGEK